MFTARDQSSGFDLRRLSFILAPVLGLFALEAFLHEGFDEHVLPGHVDFVACVAALALVYWLGRTARSRPPGLSAGRLQPLLAAGNHSLVDPQPPEACLTFREIEVLELIEQRMSNREIATRLTISEHTVKNHVKNILAKLQVESRREAVVFGRQRGWLPDGRPSSRDPRG